MWRISFENLKFLEFRAIRLLYFVLRRRIETKNKNIDEHEITKRYLLKFRPYLRHSNIIIHIEQKKKLK